MLMEGFIDQSTADRAADLYKVCEGMCVVCVFCFLVFSEMYPFGILLNAQLSSI